MNGVIHKGGVRRLGWIAALLASTICLKADPIGVPEQVLNLRMAIPLLLAVLAEAICVVLILRRWRHPRLFILWLMAMHVLTYPLFLGWLWLTFGMHPVPAAAVGEGFVVLLEGWLIYLICRYLSSAKSQLPVPSLAKSLFASLIGNICSAAAFPLLNLML